MKARTKVKRALASTYPDPQFAARRAELAKILDGEDDDGVRYIALLVDVVTSIDVDSLTGGTTEDVRSAVLSAVAAHMPHQLERAVRGTLNFDEAA